MKGNLFKSILTIKTTIITKKALFMKMLAILILVIAVIIIGSCFKKTEYGNSIGNSNNAGIAVEDGKWLYYIEYDNDEPVGICKVKKNGKKTERIADGKFSNLNILDNYIYCIEYNESENRYDLIKLKTNGKNKEILARDIDKKMVVAMDKGIYYFKNDNLYKVKPKGTDRVKISDKDISFYTIDGKWIYFIYETDNSQNYIAKMKLNGEKVERILKANDNQKFETLYVKSGKIYYTVSEINEEYDNEYSIYKMNKNGSKAKKICKIDNNISNINMQEKGLYYTKTENYNDYELKYIKYNGTDRKTIKSATGIQAINITKDWIFIAMRDENYDTMLKMININNSKENNL